MKHSAYLIVHKKILPDYLEKVIETRELLASREAATVTEAVQRAGISRNTYYKYKNQMRGESDKQCCNRWWQTHLSMNKSIIIELFQGQFKNIIKCTFCKE